MWVATVPEPHLLSTAGNDLLDKESEKSKNILITCFLIYIQSEAAGSLLI